MQVYFFFFSDSLYQKVGVYIYIHSLYRSSKWYKSYGRTFFLFVSCRAYRTNRSKVDGLQQTTFDSDIATFKMNLFRTFCPTKEIAFSIAVPTVRRQVEMYNRKNKLFLLIVVVLPHCFFYCKAAIFLHLPRIRGAANRKVVK